MKNPQDELIWQGRIHIRDEPGVYGDAAHSGLCTEYPVTAKPFNPRSGKEGAGPLPVAGEQQQALDPTTKYVILTT